MKMGKWMAIVTFVVNAFAFLEIILLTLFQKKWLTPFADKFYSNLIFQLKTVVPLHFIFSAFVLMLFSIALLGATIYTEKLNRSLRVVAAVGIFCFTFFSTAIFTPAISLATSWVIARAGAIETYVVFQKLVRLTFLPVYVIGYMLIAAVCGMLLFYKREDAFLEEFDPEI